jgi:hypothetical protein
MLSRITNAKKVKKLNVESFTNKDNFNFKEYIFAFARAFLVATSITEVCLHSFNPYKFAAELHSIWDCIAQLSIF